ncbi:MAG: UUP1 family membrane protein [Thermodesulfobacteriota bacterium]
MKDPIKRKKGTLLIASFFVMLFVGSFIYKVLFLDHPILSRPVENLWTIELKILFQGMSRDVIVRHYLPSDDVGQMVLEENFVSRNLDFFIGKEDLNTFVRWQGNRLKGEVQLFYRVTAQIRPRVLSLSTEGLERKYPPGVNQYLLTKPEMESINVEIQEFLKGLVGDKENSLEKIRAIYDFLTEGVKTVLFSKDTSLTGPIRTKKATIAEKKKLLIYLSRVAGVPARAVHGILLSQEMKEKKILSWAEVFIGGKWVPVDVENGLFAQLPENVLILYRGDRPFITFSGVKGLEYRYAVKQEKQWTFSLFYGRATRVGSKLYEWSLFSLPVETQQVFRVILMIPLGGLIVSIFRNIIGINTFGTFMPVLIAIAFRNTKLGWGLVLFSVVIALGLVSRWFMDRLRLLLVPRLSVIVTVLVIILAVGSLIGHYMGIYRILAVALFPMVIMTMTIERLSIILMERGGREAITVSLGTLLVSTFGYLAMSIASIQDFFFAFPEVLFALIGLQILLGRYTGYRLMEYFRFYSFVKDDKKG